MKLTKKYKVELKLLNAINTVVEEWESIHNDFPTNETLKNIIKTCIDRPYLRECKTTMHITEFTSVTDLFDEEENAEKEEQGKILQELKRIDYEEGKNFFTLFNKQEIMFGKTLVAGKKNKIIFDEDGLINPRFQNVIEKITNNK